MRLRFPSPRGGFACALALVALLLPALPHGHDEEHEEAHEDCVVCCASALAEDCDAPAPVAGPAVAVSAAVRAPIADIPRATRRVHQLARAPPRFA